MTKQTVLVVDDEPYILKSMAFILKRENYNVVEATNGEEALAAMREHQPGMVFLDVMMPKMTGYEVVRAARKDPELKDLVLVLLTAKGQDSDREEGLAAGANDFMTKPFSPSKILEKVRDIFAG